MLRIHAVLAAACLAVAAPALGHFAMAPKIVIEPLPLPQPQAVLIARDGGRDIARGELSDYLERLTAFDTKYQRLQPSFAAHFELLRGTAFFHPDNVHSYIDAVAAVADDSVASALAVKAWIKGQIGLYARFADLATQARADGLDQAPDVAAVLSVYAAGAKTALLEELVVSGDMEPSVAGMRAFAARADAQARRLLEQGPEAGLEITPPDEQKRLKDRWRQLRQELMAEAGVAERCSDADRVSDAADSVVLEVGRHRITLAQYDAIFGASKTGTRRAVEWRGNCSRLGLFYAAADLADQLGIAPGRLRKDIRTSSEIYLMARRLAMEAAADGQGLLDADAAKRPPLEIARALMQYPKVVEVKDWLMTRRPAVVEAVDQDFVETTAWTLRRALAPKHAIHL